MGNMAEGDSKEVLLAMKNYVQEFFGCRECARHFDQAIESGKLIDAEVSNYKDAVLLLWFLHNKANYRLSGDISEDPVFLNRRFQVRSFAPHVMTILFGEQIYGLNSIEGKCFNSLKTCTVERG